MKFHHYKKSFARPKASLFAFILIFTFSTSAWANSWQELRSGDVILLPLKCWLCTLIEQEEDTIYSHSGVVFKHPLTQELWVAEALGPVSVVPLAQFLERAEKGQSPLLLRSHELTERFQELRGELNFSTELWRVFDKRYKGLSFDKAFLWDNLDPQGREQLYCSEFVAKILNEFLTQKILPRAMHFVKNRAHWEAYFKGKIPDGKWGLAPVDFARSPLFYKVRYL